MEGLSAIEQQTSNQLQTTKLCGQDSISSPIEIKQQKSLKRKADEK